MKGRANVLLVHDYEYPLSDLKPALYRLGFRSQRARSCGEAKFVLASERPPGLVFTDIDLPDGGWADTLALATRAVSPVPVVVVSRVVDICLYLDALEAGAREFIVPPFRDADISYVVRGAMMDGSRTTSGFLHHGSQLRPDVASSPGTRDSKAQGI